MKVEDKIKALELQRADLDSQIEVLKAEATAVWRRTLVGPRKAKNEALLKDYERLFASTDIRICPVSSPVLRLASELRADTGIKTPDAIHAATAIIESCGHFLTNDGGFGRVPKLPVVLLSECI